MDKTTFQCQTCGKDCTDTVQDSEGFYRRCCSVQCADQKSKQLFEEDDNGEYDTIPEKKIVS